MFNPKLNPFTLLLALIILVGGIFILFSSAEAANRLTGNPMVVDTFGADVTFSSNRVWIQNITITAYTSAKTITFIDADGNVVLPLECPAGYSISWPPVPCTEKGCEFPNGLYFDDSASDLEANDYILIWRSK